MRRLFPAFALVLSLCPLHAAAQRVEHLIGDAYAPLAGSWGPVGGFVIGGADAEFAATIHKDVFSNRYLLTLERFARREPNGEVVWTILDAVEIGEVPDGYVPAMTTCEQNGTPSNEIIAIVHDLDADWLTVVQSAWRANPRTGRIEALPVRGIRCSNEGSGD
ncbi:MAG TPA: hypothetical protein VK610_02590 [Rhodothermales bacterium]|nr:hypothetical protein [Rhodothermales bacterium]